MNRKFKEAGAGAARALWTAALLLAAGSMPARELAPPPTFSSSSESATEFFNRVAGRLLQTRLGLNLQRLEVHPRHQLDDEARRLLQVTANLWDAACADHAGESFPFVPTVFKPRWIAEEGALFVAGYETLDSETFYQDLQAGRLTWLTLPEWAEQGGVMPSPHTCFFEIPLLLGARPGFPNLNEIAAQSVVRFARKLEIKKALVDGPTTETNVMFVVGYSNALGLEVWYPYTNGFPENVYPRPLEIFAAVATSSTLTNDDGLVLHFEQETNHWLTVPARTWGGAWYSSQTNHFRLPLISFLTLLPASVYERNPTPHFEPVFGTHPFEMQAGVYTNQWGLSVSNRVLGFLFDRNPAGETRLVDAVTLSGLDTTFSISDLLNRATGGDPVLSDLWNIEPYDNVNRGVRNQIIVSAGLYSRPSEWLDYGGPNIAAGTSVNKAIAFFRQFLGLPSTTDYPTNDLPPPGLSAQTPFIPVKSMIQTVSWQADDPFVHHRREDLMDGDSPMTEEMVIPNNWPLDYLWNLNLMRINDRYRPWGGRHFAPDIPPAPNLIDPSLADPLVHNPDQWRFPDPSNFNVSMLGRIHRGTPWQTLYLKSAVTSPAVWDNHGRNPKTHPTNDWSLVPVLVETMNSNSPLDLLSVNDPRPEAWAAALHGIMVVTNHVSNCWETVMTAESPLAAAITDAILQRQSQSRNGIFHSIGELLSIPALSLQSPWLNLDDPAWYHGCLDDAAFEAIPAQLLPRLRIDPIGSIERINGELRIHFTGWDDVSFQLQGSSDFKIWQDLEIFQTTNGMFDYIVDSATAPPFRFYRTRLLPP